MNGTHCLLVSSLATLLSRLTITDVKIDQSCLASEMLAVIGLETGGKDHML